MRFHMKRYVRDILQQAGHNADKHFLLVLQGASELGGQYIQGDGSLLGSVPTQAVL